MEFSQSAPKLSELMPISSCLPPSVRSRSTWYPGMPVAAMSRDRANMASLMLLPPSVICQLIRGTPTPSRVACFYTSARSRMIINGRYPVL